MLQYGAMFFHVSPVNMHVYEDTIDGLPIPINDFTQFHLMTGRSDAPRNVRFMPLDESFAKA